MTVTAGRENLPALRASARRRWRTAPESLPQASLPAGTLVLPLVYGIGTALPVLVVAFLLAYSAQAVGKTYNVLSQVEWWARMITGWLFVLVGIYFSLKYVFEVF